MMDRLVCEIRRQINKRKWEKWKAKQNKVREKTYFHCWNEVDEPERAWTHKNSGSGGWYNGYIATSLGYFGTVWSNARNVWEYNFRVVSVGESRYRDDNNLGEACGHMAIEIEKVENPSSQHFWTSSDPKYVGAWPHAGTNAYYYEIAFKLATLAIGAINSYAGFALSALDLVRSLLSAYDDGDDINRLWRVWDFTTDQYPGYRSDVSYFFWWLVDVDPNQTVKFSVASHLFGIGFECVSTGWEVEVTTPNPPEAMTSLEMRKYGITKVPVSKLEKIKAHVDFEERYIQDGYLYMSYRLPIKIAPVVKEPNIWLRNLVEKRMRRFKNE